MKLQSGGQSHKAELRLANDSFKALYYKSPFQFRSSKSPENVGEARGLPGGADG